MKLIIGLGNPGIKYKDTRHNLGFLALDNLSENENFKFSDFKLNKKFEALISQGNLNKEKIILAKPQTFMNNSGRAVAALANFYKTKSSDILVVHDEIDLPLGRIKISKNASAAGHRGVESIINNLKTKNFLRFRIGIAAEKLNKISAPDFVLKKFNQEEKPLVEKNLKKTIQAIKMVLKEGLTPTMNKFN